jgi:hypothetical protein
LRALLENLHDRVMSFLVRRRQRESMRAHASVSTQAIALVLETVETSSFTRVSAHTIPPVVIEPRVRESEFPTERLSEQSASSLRSTGRARALPAQPAERSGSPPTLPLLVETTTSAEERETTPPVRESWRVQAANKAYGAIAPEKAAATAPRCSRRC